VLEQKVLKWKPDVVLLVSHTEDIYFVKHNFAKALRKGYSLPSNDLLNVAHAANVDSKTPELQAERQLGEHWPKLMGWAYDHLAQRCKQAGVRPMWIWVPGVIAPPGALPEDVKLAELARNAGFVTGMLHDIYGSGDRAELVVGSWDAHPNSLAHKLIASSLYDELVKLGLQAK
jgi:hypothetical protein